MSARTPKEDYQNKQRFLRALTKLSKDHGLYVGGCGCCGSPWLMEETKVREGVYALDEQGDLKWEYKE